jgi:hypothetical protein
MLIPKHFTLPPEPNELTRLDIGDVLEVLQDLANRLMLVELDHKLKSKRLQRRKRLYAIAKRMLISYVLWQREAVRRPPDKGNEMRRHFCPAEEFFWPGPEPLI